ncbi:unnamed protein product [Rotaria sp. Silwood1]|nr:unnamed protein product [Rotaria sp. Silwood1]CAF3432521.1 unnamed protein product [Rotaria sp. Silwood1]CAF3436589.1 unnamed protein product [Rotaria sp. Silwood1]CAF4522295.1 unnamed protein product [Rotaria sp. Silwood1]CAF4529179.1 unnamed protein product [Rotaria sp. Silwood1]
MEVNGDSIDLYTLVKRDEQLLQRQTSPPPPSLKAIPFISNTSKFLVPTFGQVFYTDGYSSMKQDDYYERTLFDEEMEVPSIGTDKKNFDMAEMITFDILGSSTRLPLMCKMIIYQQGATHEREPPILVRDVCIQWDGMDRPRRNSCDDLSSIKKNHNEYGLARARSSDYLLDHSIKFGTRRAVQDTNRCLSMASSMTEDDDASSVMTAGGTIRHRVSHLLHRHRYLRQIDTTILGRHEFYSVPFYQYRGRRYGQKDVGIQINESDLNNTLNYTNNLDATTYSVTIIFPVRDRNDIIDTYLNISRIFHVNIPVNQKSKHTTIGYMYTKPFVTIKRTIRGQIV